MPVDRERLISCCSAKKQQHAKSDTLPPTGALSFSGTLPCPRICILLSRLQPAVCCVRLMYLWLLWMCIRKRMCVPCARRVCGEEEEEGGGGRQTSVAGGREGVAEGGAHGVGH